MSSNSGGAKPLSLGIIGCGTIAPTHADALNSIEDARLVACCDILAERAKSFGSKYALLPDKVFTRPEDFIADSEIEAICVCTPSGTHSEIGCAALRAGKAVLVEKPMDVSREAARRLLQAQKETGGVLGVVSQHQFDPASVFVKQLLDAGQLGSLVLVDARIKWYRTQDYYDSGDWRGTWKLDGGGALMNQGVHTLDLLRWMAGPVKRLWASAKTTAHERVEVEDVVSATLEMDGPGIGALVASTAVYPGFPASIAIHGTRGSVCISGDMLDYLHLIGEPDVAVPGAVSGGSASHALQVAQGGTKSAEAAKAYMVGPAWGDAHRTQLVDFIAAVREKRAPRVDGVAGSQALDLVLAVYESARTCRVVDLT